MEEGVVDLNNTADQELPETHARGTKPDDQSTNCDSTGLRTKTEAILQPGFEDMTKTGQDDKHRRPLLKTENVNLELEPVESTTRCRIHLDRPTYTNAQLQNELHYDPPEKPSFKSRLRRKCENTCRSNGSCVANFLLSIFPIITTVRTYQWRQWLLNDVIAGLSVAILHIPQGMAFALLTGVPPVYGIYSSFFPILLYMFFGTSRHITIGTMALISILIGAAVEREVTHFKSNFAGNHTLADDSLEITQLSVGVATSVTLLVGAFQIGIGILRLGVVIVYLSDAFVGGFTTGAAFHIATSQVPSIFGVKIPSYVGALNIVYKYVAVFSRITQTNVASVVISIITAIVLIFFKECINERFKTKMRVPIPVEILVVIVATVVSHFCEFKRHFEIAVVGDIPMGFPAPTIPPMDRAGEYVIDALITAIISLVISISLAKVFTKRYEYTIDTNQEILGYGIAHFFSSFFQCFAGATAPPRCMLFECSSGKTQLANIFSSILVLMVMLFMGPLLFSLPKAVLAVLIIVSLKGMFLQLKQLSLYWRKDKYDFFIWLLTWISVVFLDITLGLVVGVGVSLLTVVLRTQLSSGYLLERVGESDIYVREQHFEKSSSIPGIRIYHTEAPICFSNAEFLKNKIYNKILNPDCPCIATETVYESASSDDKTSRDGTQNVAIQSGDTGNGSKSEVSCNADDPIRAIILSCSSVHFIDSAGVSVITLMKQKYAKMGVEFVLAGCGNGVLDALGRNDFFTKFSDNSSIHVTVNDAVIALTADSNRNDTSVS